MNLDVKDLFVNLRVMEETKCICKLPLQNDTKTSKQKGLKLLPTAMYFNKNNFCSIMHITKPNKDSCRFTNLRSDGQNLFLQNYESQNQTQLR